MIEQKMSELESLTGKKNYLKMNTYKQGEEND